MSAKPVPLVLLDDTVSHLRSTLRKHRDEIPAAMTGLICGLLSHWGRQRLRGQAVIHPGRQKMAQWAGCSERHVKRLLRALENDWGILEPVSCMKGGRYATRYHLDVEALAKTLIVVGVNLHPDLIKKLRAPVVRGDMRGDMRGVTRGDTMSPGNRDIKRRASPTEPELAGQDWDSDEEGGE